MQSSKPGRKGPVHCPQIDTELTEDIFLPVGVRKMVLLKGYNLPELKVLIIKNFVYNDIVKLSEIVKLPLRDFVFRCMCLLERPLSLTTKFYTCGLARSRSL